MRTITDRMLDHDNMPRIIEPRGLTIDALERAVPAIFAQSPDPRVSANYSFIPTRPVLEAIVAEGWIPTAAQNQMTGRGRKAVVGPHSAHLIRFRRKELDVTAPEWQDGYPEIVLINSHNRTKRYVLMAGIFRMICSNGLIVGDRVFEPTRLTHYNIKQTVSDLCAGAAALSARTGALLEKVDAMRRRELTTEEQLGLARRAIEIRYRGYDTPLMPEVLLNARRPEDQGSDLWRVLNRVQEHLIVGGLSTGRAHTRPMASLFEGVGLNTSLWSAAEDLLVVQNN